MRRTLLTILTVALMSVMLMTSAAAATTHTVVKGDTMWKIAIRYEVGLGEIKAANSHIANPNLIYPGQVLNIPVTNTATKSYEDEVIRLVNDIRRERGLKELSYDWQLSRVARYKSEDMAKNNYFSHRSPTYGSPFDMLKSFGISYRSAGENIAKGYKTPSAVVNGWMNSSGHRANILNASYTHIGVGYETDESHCTQLFVER